MVRKGLCRGQGPARVVWQGIGCTISNTHQYIFRGVLLPMLAFFRSRGSAASGCPVESSAALQMEQLGSKSNLVPHLLKATVHKLTAGGGAPCQEHGDPFCATC